MKTILSSLLVFSLAFGNLPAHAADEPDEVSNSVGNDGTATADPNTRIAPGFLIHLNSPDDSKITGDYRISIDGKLSLPYHVTVNTTNTSLKGLQDRIETAYQPYFKGKPHVDTTVQQKRYWVRVLGLVRNPGPYLLREHATLDEALGLAEVRTEDLPEGYVRLEQGNHKRWISMEDYLKGGHAHELSPWRGNEAIVFQLDRPEGNVASKSPDTFDGPSARKVQVLGEVKNPGGAIFQRNADGYYYLIQRGGPTSDADLHNVELLRRDQKTNEHVRVERGDMSSLHDIREADILMVHPDRPSQVERTLQNTGIVAGIVSAVVLSVFVATNH